MHHRLVNRSHLVQVTGAQLQMRADPERVVLAAAVPQCHEADVDELIRVAAVVAQHPHSAIEPDDYQVEIAVVVVVEAQQATRGRAFHRHRKQGALVGEVPLLVVVKQSPAA